MYLLATEKSKRYATFFLAVGLALGCVGSLVYKKIYREPYPSLLMPYFLGDQDIDYPFFRLAVPVANIKLTNGSEERIDLREVYADMSASSRNAYLSHVFRMKTIQDGRAMPNLTGDVEADFFQRLRSQYSEIESAQTIELGWAEYTYDISDPGTVTDVSMIEAIEFRGKF